MLTRGERGICAYCTGEFDGVDGQMVRKKDWRLVKGHCGAISWRILPRFWNPAKRRDEVRAGNPCSQDPNKEGEYPYNPGDSINPQLTPLDILSKYLTD